MATELIYTLPGASESSIFFDATPRQGHERTADVTEHPVDAGAAFSDHVRVNLPELTLDVVISNKPTDAPRSLLNGALVATGPSGSASVLLFDQAVDRVRLAFDELDRIIEARILVRVVTTLRDYDNLVLRSVSVNREASTKGALLATLLFKRIKVVATQTVEVPEPAEPRGRRAGGRGTQAAAEAERAPDPGSALANLTGLGIRVP